MDLRVSRTIRFGRLARVELLLDVLNALDDTAEEGLANDDRICQEFWPALSVHGSATRDARREAEPGPVILGSRLVAVKHVLHFCLTRPSGSTMTSVLWPDRLRFALKR